MLRRAVLSAALALLLIAGLALLLVGFRFLPLSRRLKIKRGWSRLLLFLCGVSVRIDAPATIDQRSLIVMNHVSWLDIFIVNSFLPSTFIAKSEIRRWPLVGWLVAGAGTIFIERHARHAVAKTNHEVRSRLSRGERVAFFPEGTTSEGLGVLTFHSSLFAVALSDDEDRQTARQTLPILPVALRFFEADRRSTIAAYVGDQSFLNSLAKILLARGLCVEVRVLPQIMNEGPVTRQALARLAQQAIGEALA